MLNRGRPECMYAKPIFYFPGFDSLGNVFYAFLRV